jgi:hypothetical protein
MPQDSESKAAPDEVTVAMIATKMRDLKTLQSKVSSALLLKHTELKNMTEKAAELKLLCKQHTNIRNFDFHKEIQDELKHTKDREQLSQNVAVNTYSKLRETLEKAITEL